MAINKKGSINKTLMTWFMFMSLVPLVFISIFSYYQSSNSLIDAAKHELEHSGYLANRLVKNWIEYRFMDVRTLANAPSNIDLITKLKSTWASSQLPLSEFVESDEWYTAVEGSKQTLDNFILTYDYVYDAMLLDERGNVLFSLTKENDFGKNLHLEQPRNELLSKSIQQAITSQNIEFSGLTRYLASNNTLTAFFVAPLIDDNSKIQGAIAVQITLDHLFYLLSPNAINQQTLTHYFVGQDAKLRTPIQMDKWDETLNRVISTQPINTWLNNALPEGDSPSVTTYIGPNQRKVIGHRIETAFDNFKWLLISEIDFDEANETTITTRNIFLILTLLLCVLALITALILSKKLTTPLVKLTKYTQEIKQGIKHENRLSESIQSSNEIGTLINAFDDMIENHELHEYALEKSRNSANNALAQLKEQKFALDQHSIVAITNPQGTITFVNEKFSEISGYDIEELIGKNHRILKSGHHSEEFFETMYQDISNGRVWNAEICNRAKDGHLYWVDTTIIPFMDDNGRPINYIAIRTDISKRKETELYLEENAKKLELVINSTQVGIWDWLITTGAIECNERWYNIAGYTQSDFTSFSAKHWQAMLHEDDLPQFKTIVSNVMKGQSDNFYCELRVMHKAGHWVWVINSGKIVERDVNEFPVRMIGTLLDITQLKKTELGLARVQAFSTGIFNSVADGIISIDTNGIIQSFNPAAVKMYGFTQEEVVGKNVSLIIPTEYKAAHANGLEHFSEKEKDAAQNLNKVVEVEGLRKDGSTFPVELTISKVNIENELYFTALSRDITVRKRQELQQQLLFKKGQTKLAISKLMANHAPLQERVHSALQEFLKLDDSDYIFEVTVLLSSNYHENNTIFSSEGMLSKENTSSKAFYALCTEIAETSSTNKEVKFHNNCAHSGCANLYDKSHSHYVFPLVDSSDENKDLLGSLIISVNSNCMINGDDYANFNEIAQTFTLAITREKARNLLKEASEIAEQSSQLKSEFLASMSHEIRTPMNGVLGMLNLLINSNLTKEQEHKAYIAQQSAESLLVLINDILDFSKVEAGKMELELIDFNLRGMFGDFAESIAHKAQDKGLELILDITKVEQSLVKGDPGRIRQVLNNLVGNAIKFTHTGDIIIRARTVVDANQNLILWCDVEDTGIGIPEEKKANLFDVFTQVDASTTREYGGTGLGLSISKKLIELMGGRIEVESTVKNGSTFTFSVTIQESEHSELVVPKVDVKSLNLLIVDDNETNRTVLRGQLEHWGASVTEANDAKSAIEICNERIESSDLPFFDVAFLDMQMPEMNGDILGKTLSDDPRFKSMKLVMMTSISQDNELEFFAKLGFSAFFPKPATTSDIFDALAIVTDDGVALQRATPLVTHEYLKTLSHDEDRESLSTEAELSESEIQWPQNTRLLLVEDNRINQFVALGVLKEFNLTADVAGNGVEALSSLNSAPESTPYTLILMDCQMPEMDGYQTTKAIRKGDAGECNINIPIVAMTANAMEGDKQKCLDAGMSDYLTKPIDSDALLEKLNVWLLNQSIEGSHEHVSSNSIDDIATTSNDKEQVTTHSEPESAPEALSTSTDDELPIWDIDAALKRVRNNEKLLSMLIKTFIEDIPELVNQMKSAVEENNITDVHRIAHTIKGSAGNLSALHLQSEAAALEKLAKSNELSVELTESVYTATESFVDHLKSHQASLT